MSTINAAVHQPPSLPPAAPVPVMASTHASTDGDGDQGIEVTAGMGQKVNSNLSHAVQQALGHLHTQTKAVSEPTQTAPAGQLPMTMQGFIQALIASLHQIGGASPMASPSTTVETGIKAMAAASGRYTPAAASDVQSLIRQSTTVLSSNTVLQQDFQNMLRAAGIDQSATSLHHFLRSVSSQMKSSSLVDAIA